MSEVAATPPLAVSRFEGNLLRILRYFFNRIPADEALPLLRATTNRPTCLSAAAVYLVRDTLSKGCVLYLVRSGGWKQERFLRDGEPRAGRLWQRSPLGELKLEFSRHSLEFLIWLTAHKVTDAKMLAVPEGSKFTVADQLLFFLCYAAVREESDIVAGLQALTGIKANGLCRLFYPGDFGDDVPAAPLDWNPWMKPPGSTILEALQPACERRWLDIENAKGQLTDWQQMRQQGEAEAAMLDSFLDAADTAQRWDLARFLLGTLSRLLATPGMTPEFWTGGLLGNGPVRLSERLQIHRFALSLLSRAQRLTDWEQRARERGYFDEDYAAGKFWLGEWERLDAATSTRRAAEIVQMLEPLRATASVEP